MAAAQVCDLINQFCGLLFCNKTGSLYGVQQDFKLWNAEAAIFHIIALFVAHCGVHDLVALLVELAKTAARAMPDAEIEIIEKHHDRKLDAPSGTALLLANAIKEVRKNAKFIFGRSGQAKREAEEIGIHAIRMGNIVGEHEVIIGTDSQTITLKHEAHSRSLFAEGAIAAADFLIGKPEGLYDMKRMLEEA